MHDPRTSTALRQLADLATDRRPSAWTWAISTVDTAGRVQLPPRARSALGATADSTEVAAICRRLALILGHEGPPVPIDSRGRVLLPNWLRRGTTTVLIGTADCTVLIAPSHVLDSLGDTLLRTRR